MTQRPILIIGGGNMGGAMALRLHAAHPGSVAVVEHDSARRTGLTTHGIATYATLEEAPGAATYLLAIKPQQWGDVARPLSEHLGGDTPLLLSIMAGIPLAQLHAVSPRAVRIMPNLPAVIGESMSVACAPTLDAATRATVTDIFSQIGRVAWVEDEEQLHAITAISGSGPGYVFAFMEALEHAAKAQGIAPELARQLVRQTLCGAALLASQSPETVATLRAQVTSKGGTTEAALTHFAQGDLEGLVRRAVDAAATRSRVLANP